MFSERSFRNRALTVATPILLMLTALGGPLSAAEASACTVVNRTSGDRAISDLQAAIDVAAPGDVLSIKGRCVGTFVVTQDISLVGSSTSMQDQPVLSASHAGRVLSIKGTRAVPSRVAITDLRITGGAVDHGGGGIRVFHGSLTLRGTTEVTANTARHAGGVMARYATVRLQDDAAVTMNTVQRKGGGIKVLDGRLAMADSSAVSGNTGQTAGGVWARGPILMQDAARMTHNVSANGQGGAIWTDSDVVMERDARLSHNTGSAITTTDGQVVLRQHATIAANDAPGGTGITLDEGQVTMRGHAKVVRNTTGPTGSGGGVLVFEGTFRMLDHTRLSQNSSVHGGGGLTVYGESAVAVIGGRGRINKNETVNVGGGVEVLEGVLKLRKAASITANIAGGSGGGIWIFDANIGSAEFAPCLTGTLCGNTPDDWPTCAG